MTGATMREANMNGAIITGTQMLRVKFLHFRESKDKSLALDTTKIYVKTQN